jgi:hypothetical protein
MLAAHHSGGASSRGRADLRRRTRPDHDEDMLRIHGRGHRAGDGSTWQTHDEAGNMFP